MDQIMLSGSSKPLFSAQFHPKSVLLFLTVCSIYSFRSSSDAIASRTIPLASLLNELILPYYGYVRPEIT